MPVTQKQIAEELGVSRELVKHALNGYPGIAESTRARILEAARRMGYDRHANGAARTLVARRHGGSPQTGIIAVLSAARGVDGPLRFHPFFMPFFVGVDREAERRDLDAYLLPVRVSGLPRLVAEGGVDGVICIATPEVVAPLRERRIPVVALNFHTNATVSLVPDERDGMRQATRYLIAQGHRRIGYVSFPSLGPYAPPQLRLQGFRDALEEAGIPFESADVVETRPYQEPDVAFEAVRAALQQGREWTALACYNDLLAMGAVRALQEAGLRVPEDVSVIGFDDISLQSGFTPTLTSISFDREGMGRRAVELLCAWIESGDRENAPESEIFPVTLAVRDSVADLH